MAFNNPGCLALMAVCAVWGVGRGARGAGSGAWGVCALWGVGCDGGMGRLLSGSLSNL